MTRLNLKIIAIIAMVIDHLGVIFLKNPERPLYWSSEYTQSLLQITEVIGMTTFPIFSYLMVQGLEYTRNINKWIASLFFLSIVSAIPYYFLFNVYNNTEGAMVLIDVLPVNNIFFTLTVSLIMLKFLQSTKSASMSALYLLLAMIATYYSDWGLVGPILIYFLYMFKSASSTIIVFSIFYYSLVVNISGVWNSIDSFAAIGFLIPAILLFFYNNKQEKHSNTVKWFFYWFYPAHLAILAILEYSLS